MDKQMIAEGADKCKIRRLGKNIALFAVGSFASKLLGYFLLPFYTSILSTEEYGIYDLVITSVNLIFPVFTLLLSEAVMRFALDKKYDSKNVFSIAIYGAGIGFFILLLLSPLILLSPALSNYYMFFILYYFAYTLHTVLAQFSKGIEKTIPYTISGVIGTAISLILSIVLLAVFRIGVSGYFIATISGCMAASIYLCWTCHLHRYLIGFKKCDRSLCGEMLRYSLPMIPNTVSWWISTSSDKYFITFFINAAATGLYSVAYKIPSLLTMFTSILLSAWQISAVENFGSEKTRQFYNEIYNYFFLILVVTTAGIIAFSKIIARILFSNQFYGAWVFVPVLVDAYLFHDLSAFLGSIYTSGKKTAMLFYSTMLAAVLNIVLNILLIPYWGIIGAAITTLISYFAVWAVRFFDTKKLLKIDYRYLEDGACLILLGAETFVVCMDVPYALLIALVFVSGMLFIKRKIIMIVFRKALTVGKNRFHNYNV